jgi:arylsulfatase A-like enzyme
LGSICWLHAPPSRWRACQQPRGSKSPTSSSSWVMTLGCGTSAPITAASGRTPNLDKLAAEGMLFTDDYADASCTAGRANFITGELPIRTGMTTVGQAGSPIGIPAEAVPIATALKSMGSATGQFGKNQSTI